MKIFNNFPNIQKNIQSYLNKSKQFHVGAIFKCIKEICLGIQISAEKLTTKPPP